MRNITPASLAKIAAKTGTEPVCLVEVSWAEGGESTIYGDRYYEDEPLVDGRIMKISTIDSSINFSGNGSTQSVTVTLNDTDGQLKQIFNNTDIHRRPVNVWQWFTGIPLSEKFLIFTGLISSPIEWDEGSRQLTFVVLSKLDNFEVGFSPEEGTFPSLPQNMIGQAWPLHFGKPQKVPTILVDAIPHGSQRGSGGNSVTKDAHGIHDPALDAQIKDNEENAIFLTGQAHAYFILYLQASNTARALGEVGDLEDIDHGRGRFARLAQQYLKKGNDLLFKANAINRKTARLASVRSAQQKWERDHIGVTNGSSFPQGQEVAINIDGALHFGYFNGDTFYLTDARHPASELYKNIEVPAINIRVGDPVITRTNFFFADAGSAVFVSSATRNADGSITFGSVTNGTNVPIRYIVACSTNVTVDAIWAYRTVNGYRQLYYLPAQITTDVLDDLGNIVFNTDPQTGEQTAQQTTVQIYEVLNLMFGTLPVTAILLSQPLSSLLTDKGENQGWEDEIFVSVTSAIGPNTVDIMLWLIETYTDFAWDVTSFTTVRAILEPYPMHFSVTDRPSAIKLLQDLAYQARCVIYLKGNTFFIKYLPVQEAPVDTITEADIIHQTLKIKTTETENIITKYVAKWKPDYTSSKEYEVILRYNSAPYGVFEQSFSYYAYNLQQLVEKSATFWMMRTSNIFKVLECRVPLTKLGLEIFDTVLLNFSHDYVANGPVIGLIQKAALNPDDYVIDLEVWVPVRLGEMELYRFAFPSNLTVYDYWPTLDDQNTGRAGSFPGLNSDVKMPDFQKMFGGDEGSGGQLHITERPLTYGADPTYVTDTGNTTPQVVTRVDSTQIRSVLPGGPGSGTPKGTTEYQFDKQTVNDDEPIVSPVTATYPGKIVDGSGELYTVDIYYDGLDFEPTTVDEVQQLQIDPNESIPAGTWCSVMSVVTTDDAGEPVVNHYMQVPIWL